MSEITLEDRGKALEDAFFAKQQAELLKKMQAEQDASSQREALSSVSGITNEEVLDQLIAVGMHPETVAAVSLVPLVAVAWADGNLDDKERNAILAGARENGLQADHAGYQLLESWLSSQPGPTLLSTWKDYIRELLPTLSREANQELRQDVMGRARSVAEASGGFLGMGSKISRAEQDVLTDLEGTFS